MAQTPKTLLLANELVEVRNRIAEMDPLLKREKELREELLKEMTRKKIMKQLDSENTTQIYLGKRVTKKVQSAQQAISYLEKKGILDDYMALDEKRYLMLADQIEVPGIVEQETDYITVKPYKPDKDEKVQPTETQAQFIARVRQERGEA